MKKINLKEIENWYDVNHVKGLGERYLSLEQMRPYLKDLGNQFLIEKIGESFQERDIYKLVFGKGTIRLLLWTQMHGNESTGTRAFIDLIRFFKEPGELKPLADLILNKCTIYSIPMLNPDGAEVYARVNAQGIDLNRDVIDKKAVESRILQEILEQVRPEYCFNLHDQRTIFSVGDDNQTATLSFLAPSVDEERSITEGRKQTMRVIAAMNALLQELIPGRIGRYTDEFYPTATGDNFQKMGHNTILIESGHSKGDYKRMESRRATFMALLEGMRFISLTEEQKNHEEYFDIPNNKKKYLDIIIKKVAIGEEKADIGVLFIEKFREGRVFFEPSVNQLSDLEDFSADETFNGEGLEFANQNDVEIWVKNKFN